jgi:bacillolysin
MKKYYTTLILFFLFSNILNAQVLYGPDAEKIIPGADVIRLNDDLSTPSYIHLQESLNLNIENLTEWAAGNLKLKEDHKLVLKGSEKDNLGMIHYRYQQYFKNIPVYNSMLIVHTLNGKILSMNGEYFTGIRDNFYVNFKEKEALKAALAFTGASLFKWELMEEEALLKSEMNDQAATYAPKGELVYVSINNSLKNEDFRLAYKFDIYAQEPMSRSLVFVDASNGKVIYSQDLIETINVPGNAHTKYSGIRSFTTDSTAPGNYRLRETGKGLGIETYNLKKTANYGSGVDFTDTDNDWNNINTNQDEVASDAHWGAEVTYDFYKVTFNRNSINNNGQKLLSYVHYNTNYNNAFWDGTRMTYGDGNGTTYTPFTALDVCGHEISHGLTSNTANLAYMNESGALNESFSDIFGTTIEFFGRNGAGNWKIGEDIMPSAAGLRNMALPKNFANPNTYKGTYWVTNGTDNGGVHTNSGVQNFWYYLMCAGGSGTNDNAKVYNVPGVGMTKAAAIAYRNLTVYLTPNSQYADSRFYSIQATKDLFGTCAAEVKVTTNTWAAVGVGADFDSVFKASFYSNDTIICGNSGTAKFVNNSTNSASATWDFGDGSAKSNVINPSHIYASSGVYTVKLVVSSCSTPVKFDSITRVNYINVSTTHPSCLAQKMPAGNTTGAVITLCAGKLMDDGGANNYSDQTNSVRTISPTGAGYIRLKFNSFNFENNYDYLYIYDGPNMNSPLIGRYTGTTLPNGGTIVTTQGSVTFRQSSDQAVNASGFDLDWQCYNKSANDISVIRILPIKSARQNTPAYLPNSTVAALVKNAGTVQQSNIPVGYSVNGGPIIRDTTSGSLLPNEIDTVYFTTPIANSIGVYFIKAFSSLPADTINNNDTAVTSYKIVENDPVTLPFMDGFENMGPDSSNLNVFSLNEAGKFDYDNNDSISHYCRFRNRPANIGTHAGTRLMTFDRSAGNSAAFSNFLTLTVNLSNYLSKKVLLEFYYKSHQDESQANDKVWIRGSMNDQWIEAYNLIPNDSVPTGIWFQVTGIRIDSILNANGQTLSTNTQVRWGQQDNNRAISDSSSDGISFDDIKIYYGPGAGINIASQFNDLLVYPNPSSGLVNISGIPGKAELSMHDITGKLLGNYKAENSFLLDVSHLAKGIYMLNIKTNSLEKNCKIVVE